MVDFKFDKSTNCLAACSFGPDSMALLGMLMKDGIKPIVCHVNYHTRGDTSLYEEKALREFCEKNDLTIEVLDASKIKVEGNFEAWARKVRYMFFKQMYVKYHASCLFVGHQQDDLLETYVLQKDRNSVVATYGLDKERVIEGMRVVRPLLVYTKQDLLEYCHENQIPYSIDVTNFETKLKRNKIRHEIISKMSEAERDQMLTEISKENKELQEMENNLNEKIEIGDELDIRLILSFAKEDFASTIRKFVNKDGEFCKISHGQIDLIRQLCLSQSPNNSLKLDEKHTILKEYDVLVMADNESFDPYEFEMKEPSKLETKYFDLDFSMGAEDRKIKPSAYPIKIRCPKEGDEYIVGANLCPLRRLFIDWKMPLRLRKSWPVVENKDGKIVYVPRYRKQFLDNHISKFIIKL